MAFPVCLSHSIRDTAPQLAIGANRAGFGSKLRTSMHPWARLCSGSLRVWARPGTVPDRWARQIPGTESAVQECGATLNHRR
jgi:hypothetical protein